MAGRKPISIALPLAAICLSLGCGSSGLRERVYSDFARGDFTGAARRLEELGDGGRDAVLTALDRGAILQAAGDPAGSNAALFKAEALMEALYTRSLSRELAAVTLTPQALPYRGEDHERVLLHVLAALNFLELGDLEGALVECRAINTVLNSLSDRGRSGNRPLEDAFARYLSGLIFEAAGDDESAWIDLAKAWRSYHVDYSRRFRVRPPPSLANDLRRLAARLGRPLPAGVADGEPVPQPRGHGELVLVVGIGMAPPKREASLTLYTADQIPVKVAVPRIEIPPRPWDRLVVEADGEVGVVAELVEDVAALAAASVADRIDREYVKAGARVAAKYLAARKAREKGGWWAGLLTGWLGASLEQADLRSWRTLPREFQMARIHLPPGEHELTLRIVGGRYGRSRAVPLGSLEVRSNQRTFCYRRVVG